MLASSAAVVGGSADGMASGPAYRRKLKSDLLEVSRDLLVVWNAAAIAATGYGCALLYIAVFDVPSADFYQEAGHVALLGAILSTVVMTEKRRRGPNIPAVWIAQTARRGAILVSLLLVVNFLTKTGQTMPRLWMISWIASAFAVLISSRWWLSQSVQSMYRRGLSYDRVAVVGGGPVADELIRHIDRMGDSGIKIVSVLEDDPLAGDAKSDIALTKLLNMGRRGEVDRVILTLPMTDRERVFEIVYRLKALDVEVAHCPPMSGLVGMDGRMTSVAGAPAIILATRPIDRWGVVMKEIEDRMLAALAIAFLSPVMLAVALAIRLDSPGPIIFRQQRHGWNNTEFQVFKFRTMRWQADPKQSGGAVQTQRADSRITRVGDFLRRTSLDELPQFFNVLLGTMSLVGPRPHPVVMRTEQRLGEEIIAEYSHRHRVKPGITGWAQVNGLRGATETAEQVRKRVEYDIFYIEHWSLLFDLKILFLTPYRVLFSRDNAF
jgi:Undecaprenyl-phosphate glucose phosphotransferase